MNSSFAGLHILWGSFQCEHFGVRGGFRSEGDHLGLVGVIPPAATTLPGPVGAPTAG